MDADQKKLWMGQWRSAAVELDLVRSRELRELSEEASAELFNHCAVPPADCWIPAERSESSGLVEQQAVFKRARSHASSY